MRDIGSKPVSARRPRLVVASNRGPYIFKETPEGLTRVKPVSGLVSAVEPLLEANGGVWIGWAGRGPEEAADREDAKHVIPLGDRQYIFREAFLTEDDIQSYYHGFANRMLWPLCLYFNEKCRFEKENWESYVRVNEKIARSAVEEAGERDLIWVHDYHLALVPELVRRELPGSRIAFFWHIPFPSPDIFRILPTAESVLKGILGSDLVGFHIQTYVRNFLSSIETILATPVNIDEGAIWWQGRKVMVKASPIGIDFQAFNRTARRKDTIARAHEIRRNALSGTGTGKIILGADRLDYTKGILERLLAIERFFEKYPEFQGKVIFIQIAVPSRAEVGDYQEMRRQIEEAVGRINGRVTREGRIPVHYLYRSLSRRELVAHYLAADVALITPLRDGLNLVAKEFVASRIDSDGVLILSELAGASEQLSEALIVNPYDLDEISDTIRRALEMPEEERRQRMEALRKNVEAFDLSWWLEDFISPLMRPDGVSGKTDPRGPRGVAHDAQ